jgi:hypothetical protein
MKKFKVYCNEFKGYSIEYGKSKEIVVARFSKKYTAVFAVEI